MSVKEAIEIRQDLDALQWEDHVELAAHIKKMVTDASTRSEALFLLASCFLWITSLVECGSELGTLPVYHEDERLLTRRREAIWRGREGHNAMAYLCGVFESLCDQEGA